MTHVHVRYATSFEDLNAGKILDAKLSHQMLLGKVRRRSWIRRVIEIANVDPESVADDSADEDKDEIAADKSLIQNEIEVEYSSAELDVASESSASAGAGAPPPSVARSVSSLFGFSSAAATTQRDFSDPSLTLRDSSLSAIGRQIK